MKKKLVNKSNIFIAVLLVIALGLGAAIYIQRNPAILEKPSTAQDATPQPSPVVQDFRPLRPLPKDLTPDERLVLQAPRQNDSFDKKAAHFELVKKLAKKSGTLNIDKCEKPSPLVLSLKEGQDFSVRNDDSVAHTIIIDTNHKYKIEPNTTTSLKASFGRGAGAYGYLCEKYAGIVGFFLVEK